MTLTFLGGAKSVTGAEYLLESGGTKILVDCGLSQGGAFAERLNWEPFSYDPKELSAVLITHAHIDHTGRIPKLVRGGFEGPIISTPPTRDFAEALLLDSEHILGEEAKEKHKPPLYAAGDVLKAVEHWRGVRYHEPFVVGPFTVEFADAGHVLGSSFIMVAAEGKRVVFSGDLGNSPAPFIRPREPLPPETDFVLIESTYGGRVHDSIDSRRDTLENLIEETVKRGGTLMIPAFALERTQQLLFELNTLVGEGRIPRVPIFIDSPLAIKLTAVYEKYSRDPLYFSRDAITQVKSGDALFDFPGLAMTLTREQSRAINDVPPPKVVIAGSGMSQGGRILHHEMRYLPDSKSTIFFVGYQAQGSLGRRILEGVPEVRIHRTTIPVRARAVQISGYSAHADQPQLLEWLRGARGKLRRAFVVQGEDEESNALAQKMRDELAIAAHIPSPGESVVL
ncbi:MAG: MBL fold metallo-hydrolase [Candidatus Jorgensenbacteria bacterium]|nr:MBL fold metallo-hydrolase [Candidatus Jorgensenbacteria bacterium]